MITRYTKNVEIIGAQKLIQAEISCIQDAYRTIPFNDDCGPEFASILWNLRIRYDNQNIYTNIGKPLICTLL